MAIVKPDQSAVITDFTALAAGSGGAQLFPLLHEYVTAVTWADGSPRITSSLLIFFEDGIFKACINDRAAGRSGWATGKTVDQALSSLEAMLAGDRVEWRKAKAPGRR